MDAAYPWLLAFHIIAVIALVAGLLMYPRLLIYRLEGEGNPGLEKAMDDAARKLRNIIMTPALILVWLLGIGLISSRSAYASEPWFMVKITLVLILSGLHGYFISLGKKIAAGQRPMPVKRLRMLNELPMLLVIVIVIMVAVKPFS
ncbi:MAG: CopD family protein [Alphaproteobacteria bacterium]